MNPNKLKTLGQTKSHDMYRRQDRAGGNNEEQTPGHSEFASSEGGLLNFLQENLIQLGRKPSDIGFFHP